MQDAYLLDTGVASMAFDGGDSRHVAVRQKLAALEDSSLSICVVTIAEILYGLHVSPLADKKRHEMVRQALVSFHHFGVGPHTAEIHAGLRARLFELYAPRDNRNRLTRKHLEELTDNTTGRELGIQENDLWIVSVAVEYNLRFITVDGKMQPVFDVAFQVNQYDRIDLWTMEDLRRPNGGGSGS